MHPHCMATSEQTCLADRGGGLSIQVTFHGWRQAWLGVLRAQRAPGQEHPAEAVWEIAFHTVCEAEDQHTASLILPLCCLCMAWWGTHGAPLVLPPCPGGHKPPSLQTQIDNKDSGGMRDSAGLTQLLYECRCPVRGSCWSRTSRTSWVGGTSWQNPRGVLHVSPATQEKVRHRIPLP